MQPTRIAGLLALALATSVAPAIASSPAPVLESPAAGLERVAVMRLDGTITIDATGKPIGYTLAKPLPAALAANIDRIVNSWRFHPVLQDGVPRRAEARMRIGLAARKVGEQIEVRIDNATFPGPESQTTPNGITRVRMPPPKYPMPLMRAGVSGKVLLSLRIAPDGSVAEAVASQSMLFDVGGSDKNLRRAIAMLEESAIAGARRWRFTVPPRLGAAAPTEMTVSAPVEYRMAKGEAVPGDWQWVVRVPYRPAAWLPKAPTGSQPGVADLADGELAGGAPALRLAMDVAGQPVDGAGG
jgi:TonB family protein